MDNKVKKNFYYFMLLQLSNSLIPIFTFSILSKVLIPEKLGELNYYLAISNYFILIGNTGLNVYGVYAVSKYGKKVFKYLTIINFSFAIMSSLIFTIFLKTSEMGLYYKISYIVFVAFSFVNIDWYFSGIEEYKYISRRSLVSKMSIFLLVLFWVKDKNDVYKYLFIFIVVNLGINFFNYLTALRDYKNFKSEKIDIKLLINEGKIYYLMVLIGSIYGVLDTVILGKLSGNLNVAYFTFLKKIITFLIAIFLSLTNVLIPRLVNENKESTKNYVEKIFQISVYMMITVLVYLFNQSKNIVMLLGGEKYLVVVTAFKGSLILVFITVISGIIWQVYGISKNNPIKNIKSALFMGIVFLILSFVLVPLHGLIGMIISLIITEISGLIYRGILFRKQIREISFKFLYKASLYFLIISVIEFFIIMKLERVNLIMNLLISGLVHLFCVIIILKLLGEIELLKFFNLKREGKHG